MMALMDPVIFFASSPRLDDLCALTVCTTGCFYSMAPMQPHIIKCREMIFTEPDILASPSMDTGNSFHLIAQRSIWKTGRLQTRLQNQGLKISPIYPVYPSLYQACLLYSFKARLAPTWNLVGDWFLQGRDFLTHSGYTNAIKMNLQVNLEETYISLEAGVVKCPPMQIEDLNVSRNEMLEIVSATQGDGRIFHVQLEDSWCHVMPSMKKVRVVSLSLVLPQKGPFNSYPALKRYWKNTYGYRLPETDDEILYCEVTFFHNGTGKTFTYPSVCLRAEPMHMVPRINPKPILTAFLQDIHSKHSKACGQPLRFEPKLRHPGLSLYSARQNTLCPNLTSRTTNQHDRIPMRSRQSLSLLYQKRREEPTSLQRQISQAKKTHQDNYSNCQNAMAMDNVSANNNNTNTMSRVGQHSQASSFVSNSDTYYNANVNKEINALPAVTDHPEVFSHSEVNYVSEQDSHTCKSYSTTPSSKTGGSISIKNDHVSGRSPSMRTNSGGLHQSTNYLNPNWLDQDRVSCNGSRSQRSDMAQETIRPGRERSLVSGSQQTSTVPKFIPIFRTKPKTKSNPTTTIMSCHNDLNSNSRQPSGFNAKQALSLSQPLALHTNQQRQSPPSFNFKISSQKAAKNYPPTKLMKGNEKASCNFDKDFEHPVNIINQRTTNVQRKGALNNESTSAFKPIAAEIHGNCPMWGQSTRSFHGGVSKSETHEPDTHITKTGNPRSEMPKSGANLPKSVPIFRCQTKSNTGPRPSPFSKGLAKPRVNTPNPFVHREATTCLPSPASSTKSKQGHTLSQKSAQTGSSGSKRISIDQSDGATPKRPRPKPAIQSFDVEALAKIGRLDKVNTVTLSAWLKDKLVRCTTKDKKADLMDKVKQYLHLTQ